jgi:hypothetical protein
MIKQINFASRARPHLSSPFVSNVCGNRALNWAESQVSLKQFSPTVASKYTIERNTFVSARLLRPENEEQHMQIVFFFALWLVIALGVPAIVHVLFGSSEYPLVSLAVVFAFVGGAVLSALITGLLKDEQSSRSK